MLKPTTPKKILVIDDDPTIVALVTRLLESQGYDVIATQEAPVGLQIGLKQKPDLILMDVMMPIINGYNICRLLKAQPEHRSIPIILLTARREDQDIRIGSEVGADAYILKPFDTADLLSRVRQLLKEPS